MKNFLSILSMSVMLLACSTSTQSPTSSDQTSSVDLPDYKNATYLVEGSFVTLTNGFFEVESAPGSATKITTRYFGNEAIGDLNSDGKNDVAFLLTQSSGGSGTFFYVVAAIQTSTGVEGTNAIFLGDRIAPQSTRIESGIVTINYADRNPGEPFTTQPSLGVSKYFKIENNILAEAQNP